MGKKRKLPEVIPTLGSGGYYRYDLKTEDGPITIRAKSIQQFYAKLAQKQQEIASGETPSKSNPTFQQWAVECLETYVRPRNSFKVYRDYVRILENHVYPDIGRYKLRKVQQIDLQRILNEQAGKSKSHIHKVVMLLRLIYRRATDNQLIAINPCNGLAIPEGTTGGHREITSQERAYILQVASYHFAGAWIKTILYAGLQPQETIALLWTDIDLEAKLIHVKQALKSDSHIGPPKSDAGIRNIPIPDVLLHELLALKAKAKNNHVFTQQRAPKRHTQESLRCYWESFLRELDIVMGATVYRNQIVEHKVADDLTPYCLRHTYCTDLQDAGVPLNVAKYLMGHSDIQITAQIYTHHTAIATENALQAINCLHNRAETAN